MILSKSFFFTLREDAKDEESKSGNLLVRGGFIKKTSSGVYMILPLGFRVLNKIENIIREEMDAIGTQEMSMPTLISEEVFEESGRKAIIGESMFQLKDRYQKPFVLGPTHEELFANAAGLMVKSYKDMPVKLYQFQTKFRDEARPRFGLIRVREFVMKDAYSFDKSLENLDISYALMKQAYNNVFDRLDLNYRIVTADTGIMGGLLSEEYQAVTGIGEDVLVLGEDSGYASNLEVAENIARLVSNEDELKIEKVHTPNAKTIDEVSSFMNQPTDKFVKTLIYRVDDKFVAVCVSGDREVNEVKLTKLYNAMEVELADFHSVMDITGASVGFAGPKGLNIDIVVDHHIEGLKNFIIGANEDDYHLKNVNYKDFEVTQYADVSNVHEGDPNPQGDGVLTFTKGIEIGNIFKLGTKYSKAMGLEYTDENNKLQPVWMGSYGIGLGRVMAAVAEQTSDEMGLKWPVNIAPYQVAIVVINDKDEAQMEYGLSLYHELKKMGIDPILDDRKQRPGVKFKDMELIGIPYQITIGKDLKDSNVEFKKRGCDKEIISTTEIASKLQQLISENKK